MAKEFYTNGIGSAQTLNPSDESKIKIYPTEAALDADLANLEENEIVATDEDNNPASGTQYPVDVVQDGNMHAVTSNAVAGALDIAEFVDKDDGFTTSFTCTETGIYYITAHTYFSNGSFDGLKINDKSIGGFANIAGSGSYYGIVTVFLKKNDIVTINQTIGNSRFFIRGYNKLSEFFN